MCSQLSPPSVVLYRPVPTEMVLRVHVSPVPTQTVSGSCGSMRMAPIDWLCSSKTGFQVRPASRDFQTPPLAAPT